MSIHLKKIVETVNFCEAFLRKIARYFSEYNKFKLSNGVEYRDGDYVWVEVSPVKWLIDDRTGTLRIKEWQKSWKNNLN